MRKSLKALTLLGLMTVAVFNLSAQKNNFRGTIKYSVESAGETKEIALKFYDDNCLYKTDWAQQLVKGRKLYAMQDFSQIINYIKSMDLSDCSYQGDGKIILKQELSQAEIDSLTIPCTEGFYIEYIAGETKEIAGLQAKKARYHLFDDEGNDKGFEIWYTDEIGPEYDLILAPGLKGVPLELVITADNNITTTYKATEVKKEKLKDAEFLLPAGFNEITEEEFKAIIVSIQEAQELME